MLHCWTLNSGGIPWWGHFRSCLSFPSILPPGFLWELQKQKLAPSVHMLEAPQYQGWPNIMRHANPFHATFLEVAKVRTLVKTQGIVSFLQNQNLLLSMFYLTLSARLCLSVSSLSINLLVVVYPRNVVSSTNFRSWPFGKIGRMLFGACPYLITNSAVFYGSLFLALLFIWYLGYSGNGQV